WTLYEKCHKPFTCPEEGCTHRCTTEKNMIRHTVDMHCRVKEFTCKQCNRIFPYERALQSHVSRSHTQKKLECDSCGVVYKSHVSYKNHLHTHLPNPQLFQCLKCGPLSNTNTVGFISQKKLREHDRLCHWGLELNFPCEHCECRYMTKRSLNKHIRQKHSETLQLHKCDVCSFETYNMANMNLHVNSVHIGKRKRCEPCDTDISTPNFVQHTKSAKHQANVANYDQEED
ncbi:MAG: C2H2-type zinc finger protein, partial [Candidatus Roizmanbacteria bacterium]